MPTVRKIVESSQLTKIMELPAEMKNTKVELIVRPLIEKKKSRLLMLP